MDYYKNIVPSQMINDRGSNLVIINPGSDNVRIGLASHQAPFSAPHCIAHYANGPDAAARRAAHERVLNPRAGPGEQLEREKAYDTVAGWLKIPYLHEEAPENSFPRKTGPNVGITSQSRTDASFTWTNVMEKKPVPSSAVGTSFAEEKQIKGVQENSLESQVADGKEEEYNFRKFICGDEALKIPPSEPYYLNRPIKRGHLNISQYYPFQQVLEDLHDIWNWILTEKLHIPSDQRNLYAAILVLPETFDNREIKEMISLVLRDLKFGLAVAHQEGLAAAFGNGLSTACVVNIGAQVTSVICVEDGVALPSTCVTLPYGGEDISRCLLWVQQRHQSWPSVQTDPLAKPVDMFMLNKLKETYCQIREGEFGAVAIVHSYDEDRTVGSHKTRLSALNVPPMGLFCPRLFALEECPRPPRSWFHDYEDMLEDTCNIDFPKRPDMPDATYASVGGGINMWDNYPLLPSRLKKDDNLGLAEAITSSILSTGRLDLQRKLFCSIQLIGGVALTAGLVPEVEDRVLHAIPSNEAIDTVEVLQSRSDPSHVSWKGGAILGILDFTRDAWIYREDWLKNGIHVGNVRKYKDSFFLQAQSMCYINTL